jgi:hypothetical protein
MMIAEHRAEHESKQFGEDRRGMCDYHGRLEEVLGRIEERQINYIDRHAAVEQKLANLEKIVTNGLSHNIAHIKDQLAETHADMTRRLTELEEFGWFRKPVTKMKDSLFWYALKVAIVGGGLYIVMHFGDKLINGMVK